MYENIDTHARYFLEVSRAKMPVNAQAERTLFERYHEHGDMEARRLLIEGGLRFVIAIAKRYDRGDPEFLRTLIAAGNVGLITAVDRYCPWMIRCPRCNKDNFVARTKHQRCRRCNRALCHKDAKHYTTRFLTYAAWWITEAVRTTIYKTSLVHIPPYKQKEHHRARQAGKKTGFTYVPFEEANTPSSQTNMYRLGKEATVYGEICDSESDYAERHTQKLLHNVLRTLKDRHAYVIIAYYGLRGDCKTLREIAEKLDICPERVRQIKEEALKILKVNLRQQCITSTDDVYWN